MQSFPSDTLSGVVWNSVISVHLLKAPTYPNLIVFFGIKSQCPSIQTYFLLLIFIMKTGNMISDKKLMTEN